ncbi:type IIG restriction enzyme/methyltransferase [Streptococcus salivarius]
MAIKELSLKGSMNRSVQAIMPLDEDKEVFGKKLITYLTHLNDNQRESEEYQKNLLKSFLEELLPHNFINTSNRIDLAIYNGKDSNSTLGVIFEHKSLTNKSEMMTKEKINSKAFQEIVAYYLRERLFEHNLEIKKCIVTNGLSWFVIEAKEIEKHFTKNKKLVDLVTKFKNNQLSSNTTDFLYNEVISPAIDLAIDKGIEIAHFDLRDALVKNSKSIEIKKNNLTQLYRFFTAENLLNKEIFTDSNKLNKNFYDELLYLMGLEESKVGTSKIISRLKPSKRQQYSFVENIIDKLEVKDVPKDRQEDIAIQLTVIWMNRILFLKLLESQLVLFNKDESYRFLTFDKLPSFVEIYTLFFAVLAKKITDRNERVQKKFGYIPYLNSSLFEENELEVSRDGIGIDRLPEGDIEIYTKTSLKGSNNKRKSGKINFIQYLFEFLDSYDFSTSISHHEKSKNDLINASVLGLIFEKINGYRDGSFYTPGNITMYMSRKAVRMAVVDKINDGMSWNCRSIEDVKFQIRSMEIANKVSDIIDQIKICDPAVGSGHFLVSVLNEIIALKSDLNVLFDSEGNYIGNIIQCYVINDELIIQDMSGNNFVYQVGNDLSERIQKAIFTQKRIILENTLFGVDINPSSVNICRLRLWIELLKSSYYYKDDEINQPVLTTLPNIDINIKVGDSLLHKFDFNYEFDLRRNDFNEYLDLVREYKDTNNKATKANIWDKIERLKYSFDDLASSPELKKLHKLISERNKAGAISLFEEENNNDKEYLRLNKQLEQAQKEFEERLKNPLYAGGMEWRMEFPEILGENGEFIGFDLIIGNPPYIFTRNQSFTSEMKDYYIKNYINSSEFKANTYTLFIELAFQLMKNGGSFSYIVPNNFLTIPNNSKIRTFITKNTSNVVFINSLDKIFSDASVDNCIIFFKKNTPNWIEVAELKNGEFNTVAKVDSDFFIDDDIISFSKAKYPQLSSIFSKVDESPVLEREGVAVVKTGVQVYGKGQGTPKQTKEVVDNRAFHSLSKLSDEYRRYLDGENVSRYKLTWNGEWVKYGNHMARMRNPEIFKHPRILVRQIPSNKTYSIEAVLVDGDYISDVNSHIITNIEINPYYLLGVINSKIISIWFILKFDKFQRRIFPQFKINELGEFPIPEASNSQQNSISLLVEQLMDEMKKETPDSELVNKLNLDIDNLVMDLFDLTDDEKKIVSEFNL